MIDVLCRHFGNEYEVCKGRDFYQHGFRWASGATLLIGHKSDKAAIKVEVPGSTLDAFSADDRIRLLADLSFGMRATRLDVALDWIGNHVDIITAITSACRGGQLCRARTWEPKEKYTNGELCAYGVNIGKRGRDGSGRYLRGYDKGLEQGNHPAFTWHRLEGEFTGDLAAEVQLRLLQHVQPMTDGGFVIVDGWMREAMSLVLGVVEFREVTGARHLKRRPLAAWWVELLDDIKPVLVKVIRRTPRLDRYVQWLQRSVVPSLKAMGDHCGRKLPEILRMLVGDDIPSSSAAVRSPVVWEFCRMFNLPVPKSAIQNAGADFVGDGIAPF